jgi:HTH-type transcriptional regulator, competence development regulator
MNLEFSTEWLLRKAKDEITKPISAGLLALPANPESSTITERGGQEAEAHVAFSALVDLMRRKVGLSVDDLAKAAGVSLDDLVLSINDQHHTPEPLTVVRLADYFNLEKKKLAQLAGMTMVRERAVHEQAMRFAARSGSLEGLTKEQEEALNAFVAYLARE